MRTHTKIAAVMIAIVLIAVSFTGTALAVTESEVEAQVAAKGREAVAGNLLIWFLCAIAFLKISQKIDSFMASLGVNVGNTGGSMMTELLLATRGVATGRSFLEGGFSGLGAGRRGSRGAPGPAAADGNDASFLSGGLAGAVGRSLDRGGVNNATGESGGGIGGMMYESSVESGGGFANNVISTIARGNIGSTGVMRGDGAVAALHSYMGMNGNGGGAGQAGQIGTPGSAYDDAPVFSNVEIGGGRIMGTETSADNPDGVQFGMYHADQYLAPEGRHDTVETADGANWYRQYAQDAVERTPYMAPDGTIAYNESIVQKLPDMPRRVDRV